MVVFVLVHLSIERMKFLAGTPRSRWLSVAGGVSVAHVFLHLLPELSEGQRIVAERFGALRLAEHHVYLIAMAGLVLFYGLERLASRASDPDGDRLRRSVKTRSRGARTGAAPRRRRWAPGTVN